jgi:hypothetical protein
LADGELVLVTTVIPTVYVTPSLVANLQAVDNGNNSGPPAALIGGIVGAAAGAAMLITGVLFYRKRRQRRQDDEGDAESAYAASFGVEGFPGSGEEEVRSDRRSSGSDWLSMLRFHRQQRRSRQSDFMREVFSD